MNISIPSHQVDALLAALDNSELDALKPLAFAWEILCLLATGLIPSRRCRELLFRFDGDSRFIEVQVAAILDDERQPILELDELLDHAIGRDHTLDRSLRLAAQCYLDHHLPCWRIGHGAFGVLAVASTGIEDEPIRVRGHAQMRTFKTTSVDFPARI